ncbi:hypothetical protein SAMN04488498_101673 [Mesorhizobium albiziae]|uniref:Energy-coupling factor transport system substrate-specific component n=1 Tax=Neomesorhizobium albiziae TaxID=335020 RepID=A0A1I3VR14_9HYPH|nr:hypothetical protein [Mesorhizobium albiziae]GLS29128.1 hypothetical protein GCM10007937_08350 [Mesorhizobium albiziae]SFJ97828.1 hypothetical protein SAMN04488498_101673 [Mesorhizobium albiziae]
MSETFVSGAHMATRQLLWAAAVSAASILFSLVLACATPFAAIATVAGANMSRRGALLLTGMAWLANQGVGYLVLGYPTTWDSFAWGVAVGVAAALATGAVLLLRDRIQSGLWTVIAGFVLAFVVYEFVLFAATALLPSGEEAFSLDVILQILWPNVLALAGLAVLHRIAVSVRFLPNPDAVRGGVYA